MTPHNPSSRNELTIWQLSMLTLCIYVILALATQAFFPVPDEIVVALKRIDFAICIIFLLDFVIQFSRAKDKLAYMKWGWIDLLSSIPTLDYFRWGRMVRIIRVLRILRGIRSTRLMFQIIFSRRSHGTFATVALTSSILVIFSTIAILLCETDPRSNIKTAGDALWWAFTTISTVGYGDFYPVTAEGRIIAAVLMTSGIALFGTFTAYVTSWFFEATGEKEVALEEQVLEEIKGLKAQMDAIEKKLDTLEKK